MKKIIIFDFLIQIVRFEIKLLVIRALLFISTYDYCDYGYWIM